MKEAMRLKAQIKAMSLQVRIPANAVLQNYMLERLLERISLSPLRDKIIIKGGLLIAAMVGIGSRTTMDMDTTFKDYPLTEPAIRMAMDEICQIAVNDGVSFTINSVEPIRADDEYGGFRISLMSAYDSINVPLKVDITTDDAITPREIRYSFTTMFESRTIEIWTYNVETVLAEKYETILRRGILNTRPRDFYDVYILTQTQQIDREILAQAIRATAQKRGSLSVLADKSAIVNTIRNDGTMQQRWATYCREYPYADGINFKSVLDVLEQIF